KLEASYRDAAAKRTLIRKIDNEISGRFVQIRLLSQIFETVDASDKGRSSESKEIALLLPFLLNGDAGRGNLPMATAVYPELAGRSFFGLLVELESLLPANNEREAVRMVRDQVFTLQPEPAASLSEAVDHLERLRLDRWKTVHTD